MILQKSSFLMGFRQQLVKHVSPFWLVFAVFFLSCGTETPQIDIDFAKVPYPKLSDYHFFKGNMQALVPNTHVLPYHLNSSLFTDYAHKARFVWMPQGVSANLTNEGILDFPNKSILIKVFYYPKDFAKPTENKQIIETRLLIKNNDKWEAYDYVWNESQTEAVLDVVGDSKKISWKDENGNLQKTNYVIPNKNQCKSCHNYKETFLPIGPKAHNLNKDFTYAEKETKNQLQKWAEVGYLNGFDATKTYPKMAQYDNPQSETLHERALAYLDINCGHCHNPNGPGGSSGLTLTYYEPDLHKIGLCKSPIASGTASGRLLYDIQAGKPDSSILLSRMMSLNPGEMMPEVGRTMVHKEGIALIRAWISEMKGECR